jgi:SAM-dependent methyltransferase
MKPKELTTKEFASDRWDEVRVDIDQDLPNIDIYADMSNMNNIYESSCDAIFSCHSIEHLNAHDALQALKEFKRILRGDGFAIITCPDLQIAAQHIANGDGTKQLYVSPAGPITALDMVFGYNRFTKTNPHMAHRWGYDSRLLASVLHQAGFQTVAVMRNPTGLDLWAVASPNVQSQEWVTIKAREHFPIPENATILHEGS